MKCIDAEVIATLRQQFKCLVLADLEIRLGGQQHERGRTLAIAVGNPQALGKLLGIVVGELADPLVDDADAKTHRRDAFTPRQQRQAPALQAAGPFGAEHDFAGQRVVEGL